MGEAACEPADERNNMTPREPTRAAVEAAEKLHPEYSDEWWKTIAQKSDRYGELYATARIKRNVTRAIIQTAIDSATAPLAERVRALEEDKRRLDWLEVQEEKTGRYIWEHDDPPRSKPYPGGHFIAVNHECSPFYGETYREAIDAAMKAEADSALAAPEGKNL
jgi:hypothetical protein